MFIAMNRFQVKKGCEHDFEHVWLSRDTHLDAVPGFIEFHLLKGPEREGHVLYASRTVWRLAPNRAINSVSVGSSSPRGGRRATIVRPAVSSMR